MKKKRQGYTKRRRHAAVQHAAWSSGTGSLRSESQ